MGKWQGRGRGECEKARELLSEIKKEVEMTEEDKEGEAKGKTETQKDKDLI